MRKWMLCALALVAAGWSATAFGAEPPPGPPGWLFNVEVSYLNLDPNLPRDLVMHNTHPDDRAFMSGSPGDTMLDKVEVTFLDLSLERTWGIAKQSDHGWEWGIGYTLKVPIDEKGRVEKQNENDPRPPTEGSFIYTEMAEINPAHEVGVSLRYWWAGSRRLISAITPHLAVGYWQMAFEKGWDRFGRDEAELRSDAKGFGFAPGLNLSTGTKELRLTLHGAYRFIDLEYDTDALGNEVAQGWEVGAGIGWHF